MTIRESLIAKLHPARFPGMSPKMAAIVASFLGQDWVSPRLGSFSITSDGFVMSGRHFLGSAEDFESNIARLLAVAELNLEEMQLWGALYAARVDDWRTDRSPRFA